METLPAGAKIFASVINDERRHTGSVRNRA